MKRSERHHLKENTLATWLLDLQELLETRRRAVMIWVLLTVGLLLAAGGYLGYQRSLAARGTDLLADALNTATAPVVPPPPVTGSVSGSVGNGQPTVNPRSNAATTVQWSLVIETLPHLCLFRLLQMDTARPPLGSRSRRLRVSLSPT